MVHWTSYLVIGGFCVFAAWFTYRYYRWAKWMDQINADHFEFQKQGLWIEGVSYFVAVEPVVTSTTFQDHLVAGASRFPTSKLKKGVE